MDTLAIQTSRMLITQPNHLLPPDAAAMSWMTQLAAGQQTAMLLAVKTARAALPLRDVRRSGEALLAGTKMLTGTVQARGAPFFERPVLR
jgi:hypothetical protein